MREVSFTATDNTPLKKCPPNGTYLTVSYDDTPQRVRANRGGFFVPRTFPWTVVRYVFENGVGDEMGCGSSLAYMLEDREVSHVFLVDLSDERRRELDEMLAKKNIKLIPAKLN